MFPFDDVIMCDVSLFQPRKSFRSGKLGLPGVPALRLAAGGRDHDTGNVVHMMTSSNGNIFRVTGLLCGEFTGDR